MIRYALRDPVQRKYLSLPLPDEEVARGLKQAWHMFGLNGISRQRAEVVEVEVKLKRRA